MKKYKDKSSIDMSDGILIDDEQRYLDNSNANVKNLFSVMNMTGMRIGKVKGALIGQSWRII